MTVRELWQRTLAELRLVTYPDTWEMVFAACFPLPPQDGAFVLGTHSWYAQQWIEKRLHLLPERILSHTVGRPVQVKCVLVDPPWAK